MLIVLANVTSVLLVDLPIVTEVRLLPKFQPDVEKAPLNAAPGDSIRRLAGPSMEELVEVGALFEITKPPPDKVVVPV
jgi:hypothetical protein